MTDQASTLTEEIDISSTEFWSQPMRERDRSFAELRARPGVTFHRPIELGIAGGPGFWAVTRQADIVYVSRHPDLFCSGKGVGFSDIPAELNERLGSFLMTDAPRHTHLRHLVSRAFTPRQVGLIEVQIRRQAAQIVADAIKLKECDLVADLSMRLPLWTTSEMLGIPPERREELREAADLMVRGNDAEFASTHENAFAAVLSALGTMSGLGAELAADRRREPRDDLLTALVEAEVDGHGLSDEEIGSFVALLGVAGNDTTRNSISHAVKAFAEHPDRWELLRSDPDRWMSSAVEEILRWASPVLTFRRTATRDTAIGDQAIAEGDHVVMFYGSGNRDEEVFNAPWRFDITRQPNDHVAFGGGGPHYCLGANLARTQLRSVIGELSRTVTGFEVGEPDYVLSAFVNGIHALPCHFITE